MTSVLNVDTIADKAGTGPVALTKQSVPKAWANYNGTASTTVFRASFNMSGQTDNGTGDYTFSYTNSFDGADLYTHPIDPMKGAGDVTLGTLAITRAAGSLRFRTARDDSTLTDAQTICAVMLGDLA